MEDGSGRGGVFETGEIGILGDGFSSFWWGIWHSGVVSLSGFGVLVVYERVVFLR